MKYETDTWPSIPARDFGVKRTETKLVVIHTAETPESALGAENVGRYFQNPDKPSSAQVGVDSNSIVQYVPDSLVAYAAPGANHNGVHIELCCYMGQSKSGWYDNDSVAMLALGASAAAQYCLKYDIPPVHLTDIELFAGKSGIIGHVQASRVFKKSDHQDPGLNFPWAFFMAMVVEIRALRF